MEKQSEEEGCPIIISGGYSHGGYYGQKNHIAFVQYRED
jgi:hypothetical protein